MNKHFLSTLFFSLSLGTVALAQSTSSVPANAEGYEHCSLLEEFTTENCGNCPYAAEQIEKAIETASLGEKVIQVCHHVGYYTDWLTIPASKTYKWFYNQGGSTYAPACMLDRGLKYHETETTPVFLPGYYSDLLYYFKQSVNVPAYVQVKPTLAYDKGTRKLTIQVACEKSAAFDGQCPSPRLNLFIAEDSIKSKNQAAAPNMIHRHVMRAILSDGWGDAITWGADSKFNKTYELTLDEAWKDKDIEVVAFVSEYDSKDVNKCCVFNTSRARLGNVLAGIQTTTADAALLNETYFSLSGTELPSKPSKGFFIQKELYSNGKVMVKKVFIP